MNNELKVTFITDVYFDKPGELAVDLTPDFSDNGAKYRAPLSEVWQQMADMLVLKSPYSNAGDIRDYLDHYKGLLDEFKKIEKIHNKAVKKAAKVLAKNE